MAPIIAAINSLSSYYSTQINIYAKLGNSDISITANIYTHVMPKKKVDAIEKLNEFFVL